MLALVGLDVPNYKMRDILTDLKKNNRTDGEMLSKDEFEKVILNTFYHVLHSDKLALSIYSLLCLFPVAFFHPNGLLSQQFSAENI